MGDGIRDLVNAWVEAWSSHDVDRVLALFTDDCVYEDVPLAFLGHGRGDLARFATRFLTAVPDARFQLVSCVVEREQATAEWSMTGTHQAGLPGLPPGARPVRIRGVSVFASSGDKLRSCVDYWDRAGYLQQLGVTR